MSHESVKSNKTSAASAVVTHELNSASFAQSHVRHISEFEPDPAPLLPSLPDPAMVVLTKNGSASIADSQVRNKRFRDTQQHEDEIIVYCCITLFNRLI